MSNRYTGYDDYGLQHLPHHLLNAEQWDQAGCILADPQFMEATVWRLGIDELLKDYATALICCRRKMAVNRILDRQAHQLRGWDAGSAHAHKAASRSSRWLRWLKALLRGR